MNTAEILARILNSLNAIAAEVIAYYPIEAITDAGVIHGFGALATMHDNGWTHTLGSSTIVLETPEGVDLHLTIGDDNRSVVVTADNADGAEVRLVLPFHGTAA